MTATKDKNRTVKSALTAKPPASGIQPRKRTPGRDRKIIFERQPGYYTSLGYRAARVASREGRGYTGASGEAHVRYHRLPLQNQSRDFIRNNPIYKGMIGRAVGYIVGNGFGLQAKAGDKIINADIEKRWKRFWRRPEIRNILSGGECEEMVCSELLTVGDTGVLKTNRRKIQLIEAEQIRGKKGYADDGIEKDQVGMPIKFYVGGYNKNGFIDNRTIRGILPKAFLFLTKPERPSSIRGVPPCQASFPMLHRINDVCDSEAIAWQLLARMAVVINRKQAAEGGYTASKVDPDKTGTGAEGDLATRLTELDYALMFHAEPDEDIKGIERNIPGKDFSASLRMFLRLLGLPLGLPLEIVLLDWTKSNYSQSRAVLEQAFTSFIKWQFKLSNFFMSPVYEWWLRGEIASGDGIKETDSIFEHNWLRPSFPWIDQLKEAQAQAAKIDRNFTTHSEVCKSLNADREDINKVREEEVKDAIAIVKKIEEETSVKVPYQHFCGLEPPKAKVSLKIGEEPEGEKEED